MSKKTHIGKPVCFFNFKEGDYFSSSYIVYLWTKEHVFVVDGKLCYNFCGRDT